MAMARRAASTARRRHVRRLGPRLLHHDGQAKPGGVPEVHRITPGKPSASHHVDKRNQKNYQRGVLALRMKPIYEARALAKKQEGANQYSSLSEKSHEATPDIFTNKIAPAFQQEVPKPIYEARAKGIGMSR